MGQRGCPDSPPSATLTTLSSPHRTTTALPPTTPPPLAPTRSPPPPRATATKRVHPPRRLSCCTKTNSTTPPPRMCTARARRPWSWRRTSNRLRCRSWLPPKSKKSTRRPPPAACRARTPPLRPAWPPARPSCAVWLWWAACMPARRPWGTCFTGPRSRPPPCAPRGAPAAHTGPRDQGSSGAPPPPALHGRPSGRTSARPVGQGDGGGVCGARLKGQVAPPPGGGCARPPRL